MLMAATTEMLINLAWVDDAAVGCDDAAVLVHGGGDVDGCYFDSGSTACCCKSLKVFLGHQLTVLVGNLVYNIACAWSSRGTILTISVSWVSTILVRLTILVTRLTAAVLVTRLTTVLVTWPTTAVLITGLTTILVTWLAAIFVSRLRTILVSRFIARWPTSC